MAMINKTQFSYFMDFIGNVINIMGNIPGCCNPKTQLSNLSQDKLYQTEYFDLPPGIHPEVAKIIRKLQANPTFIKTKTIQFPPIGEDIHQILKRSKTIQNQTNDNEQSCSDFDRREIIGFKFQNDMAIYEGNVIDQVANGKGRIMFGDCSYFQGRFQGGVPKSGIFVFPGSIAYYKGEIDNFQANGKGVFQYPSAGYQYEGEWYKNMQHGTGIQKYGNGEEYNGKLMYGNKFGEGKYYFSNGDVYEGEFYNDYADGYGRIVMKNGQLYQGEWKMGKFHGKGTYKWNNGEKYEGMYEQGQRKGKGTYFYKNGWKYEGMWENGLQDGFGTIIGGYDEVKGYWSKGHKLEEQ